MIWPFKRKTNPVHVGPTSVDWKPGDIAESLCSGPWFDEHGECPGPQKGQQAIVVEVFYGPSWNGRTMSFALRLLGMAPNSGWDSRHFRKIVLTDTGADRKVSAKVPERVS